MGAVHTIVSWPVELAVAQVNTVVVVVVVGWSLQESALMVREACCKSGNLPSSPTVELREGK